MAKKQSQRSIQRAEQRAAEKQQRIEARRNAQETVKRPYTLMDSMKLGRLANILFVVFIIVAVIYYYVFAKKGTLIFLYEIFGYSIEGVAFVLFTVSVVWMDKLVRSRLIMKILMITYISVEVFLMLLEFQFIPIESYNGLSFWLLIAHSIFSGVVSFSLLMLDPSNKRMERIIIITTAIILGGMFLGYAGYRVYASILLNAFAYIFFYSAMIHQLRLDELAIDCYGDNAATTVFSSTMFDDVPTMVEKVKPERESISQKAKRAAHLLNLENTEHTVLTDDDEKFEYEFGVIEEEDDDYEEEYDGDYDTDDFDTDDENGGLT